MGSDVRSSRRIIPPGMPEQAPAAVSAPPLAPAPYTPPKYVDPSQKSWLKLTAIVLTAMVVVIAGGLALHLLTLPVDVPALTANEPPPATLASAGESPAIDTSGDGWVGVLDLPIERASISISTVPDDGIAARDFGDRIQTPVTLAVIEINNVDGPSDLVIDTAKATITLADGANQQALDPVEVLKSANGDKDAAAREFGPPFRCRAGEKLGGKFLFLPRGTNTHDIAAVTIAVNGHPRKIPGSYLDAEKKAESRRPTAPGAS